MIATAKNAYNTKSAVKAYLKKNHLTPPEKTVLDMFQTHWPNLKMLDIGVGAGRTTLHFADRVAEYVGIDNADNMIHACRVRFAQTPPRTSFKVCDARQMDLFTDDYFDFILFSFNGVDYVPHEDRLQIWREIKRVGKKGGHLYFSTHNLQSIDLLRSVPLSANPLRLLKDMTRSLLIKSTNPRFTDLKERDFAVINDGTQHFQAKIYYIKPKEQIKQLQEAGFENIRLFSLENGREITDPTGLDSLSDRWLHYLAAIA